MKRQKKKKSDTGIRAPRSESVQYATGEKQGAITNSSRKNGEAGPEWGLGMLGTGGLGGCPGREPAKAPGRRVGGEGAWPPLAYF